MSQPNPTAEVILNYGENGVREKIASKLLKAFLGAGRTVGKFNGTIVNKPELVGATAEVILNYRENSLREKIASKSLKTFLGKALIPGKFTGTIVNKQLVGTPKVALISLEDFLAIATWESSVNQNIEVAKILAAGFGDSIRSIALKDFYYFPDIPLELCYNIGSTAKLLTSGALSQPIGEVKLCLVYQFD